MAAHLIIEAHHASMAASSAAASFIYFIIVYLNVSKCNSTVRVYVCGERDELPHLNFYRNGTVVGY